MKIAFLNFYSGFNNRGGETFVHELANRLAQNNEVYVFQAGPSPKDTPYQSKVVGKFNQPDTISVLPVTHILRRFFLDSHKRQELVFTLMLLPGLIKLRPDIIVPLNSGWQTLICSLYCRFSGSKLVISAQSGPGWDDRWNLLMKPHLFVALTDRQLDWAREAAIWKTDFTKISNGVDPNQFKPLGNKSKLPLKKPIIMMVAASTPDKRVEEGIRAVANLPSASLLLLGQGPLDDRINKLGYGLLGQERFFHTSVNHMEMPDYYRAANLFTLCSISSEAFGIVYLEAMSSGLACVATDDTSRHEIIGSAGVFVKNPGNTSEYAAALKSALAKKWGGLPRHQALKYSWDEIALKYHETLAKINH